VVLFLVSGDLSVDICQDVMFHVVEHVHCLLQFNHANVQVFAEKSLLACFGVNLWVVKRSCGNSCL